MDMESICTIDVYDLVCMSCDLSGDPVSIDLDRPREWNEAIRLHFYNHENELLLHGECPHTTHTHTHTHTHIHTHTLIVVT